MKQLFFLLLLLAAGLCACNSGHNTGTQPSATADTLPLSRASLLRIVHTDSFHTVDIGDAWHPGKTLRRYVLVPRDSIVPRRLPEGTLVRIPLRRAVILSAVHAALLRELGCTDRIGGLCDVGYILNRDLRKAVSDGHICDMGSSMNPDAERIVASGADALLVSPFENAGHGPLERLGIPLIECADYMETSPLGRAEWMRFFGLLFGCGRQADSLYRKVEHDYEPLRAAARRTTTRPTLLCDMKEGAAWYVPAGESTLGRLYQDAGAGYPFAGNKGAGSAALSFETVMRKAHDTDFWIVKYGRSADLTYAGMAADMPLCHRFRPWRERHIYGCNTFRIPYYEEVPFHPERLLRDLVHILHPELLPDHRLRYYHPLN